MGLGEFKDIDDSSLFGRLYYRPLTFWAIVSLILLALADVGTFAMDIYRHDASLFLRAWLPLVALGIVIAAGAGLFALWLSRMRVLFSGAENIDVTALVKKIAGDFVRLFALFILCVFVGLFIAQSISGY